jgi:hypothetical protein
MARENGTSVFNVYVPNAGLTAWTASTMTGVPAGYSYANFGMAVTASQAVTACINGTTFAYHVCVREFGAPDRLFTLTRPNGSNYSNLLAVASSGHRVALIADGPVGGDPPHLYVLDAGPDGHLSLGGDDIEVDYGVAADGKAGAVDIAGDMVAWITDNGSNNGQQVFLADFALRTQRALTTHFSTKSQVVVDASGRVAWRDGVFSTGGIFVNAP